MKHVHGIEIRLTDLKGNAITEAQSPSRNETALLRFNGQVGSRSISIAAGNAFRVLIKLHKEFKIYKAEGIKIVIVADGTCVQEDNENDDNYGLRQRYGLWWLDVGKAQLGREFAIEGFTSSNKAEAKFLAPEVDGTYAWELSAFSGYVLITSQTTLPQRQPTG